ncbi:trypsin-like peptidase domain-containing protein [Streptomyces carpinensis]|uniref:Trypsin-like peptidase domain-containing protein n=2 Tax=Streptomyces carpinensis TaxID=66369 RepID=A0ABV1W476_9ACTN
MAEETALADVRAGGAGEAGAGKPDAAVVRDALGVGVAVGLSGFAFGVTSAGSGLTLLQTCALSLLVFTGASQFALVGALAAGGNPLTAAAGAFFLGVRNTFYGLRLSQLLALPRGVRPLAAQWVIDETTAVALAQPTRRSARIGFTVTGVTLYVLWNLTTLLGALGAKALGDTDAWGLDAAGPAVFLALLAPGTDEQGTGTGFVLDRLGHILTNNHVVEPAAGGGSGGITVTFSGGQTARATIVGRDTGYDLAVVQVRGVRGLTPMPLGNSDNVQVGDPVVAIGAPFDLANTVTSGIISAKERPITAGGEKGDGSDLSYVDALQTDAPINPGNSGGPLLDSRGRVVGINSAIRSADSGSDSQTGQAGSIGLGFAIPVNQARRVAEELINTGKASHPVIGVTLDMNYTGDGARVGTKGRDGGSPVTPGGPGAKAGIRAGDVITAVDGQRVHSGEELIVKTRAHRPGDRLELTIERGGAQRKVSLVLGSSNSD